MLQSIDFTLLLNPGRILPPGATSSHTRHRPNESTHVLYFRHTWRSTIPCLPAQLCAARVIFPIKDLPEVFVCCCRWLLLSITTSSRIFIEVLTFHSLVEWFRDRSL
ncbi:hypothetical protein CEXT_734651 [Caerostris extrusa]|uniref:Uncharacterized protein n=1 Tax=Caerostris extrusa TaxID=172846 RepID=A0AAV4U2P4_CAEEX|nr:hypothetical protein CEXT_734651 [Caerostris extrusa]